MPRKNPKNEDVFSSWRGNLGRKATGLVYGTPFNNEEKQVVQPGDEIKVLVTSVTRRGEGIGNYMGMKVIVNGASDPGEIVRARVLKVKDNRIIANILRE